MSFPGAKTSTHRPKFEKEVIWSAKSTAATVSTRGSLAGLTVQASFDAFPAATTTVIPASTIARTPASSAGSIPPPRLRLATAGARPLRSCSTASIPLRISEVVPRPSQRNTLIGTIVTLLATPTLLPPMVPATCVPWPVQSVVPSDWSTEENPVLTRPANSGCVASTPESMTKAVTPAPVAGGANTLSIGSVR